MERPEKISPTQDITEPHQQTEKTTLCSEHGEFVSKFLKNPTTGSGFWSKCPDCIKKLDEADIKKESSIPWLAKRRENMRIENFKYETDEQAKNIARIKRYIENFQKVFELGSCLCLVGPPGTGKTHIATGIGVALVEKGYNVHYERMYDLTRRIKATYSKAATVTEDEIIKRIVAHDLLIIDEVGLKAATETESVLIYEIIDGRYEAVKPTIIVSNLSEKELEENLGARTIDRLYENHGAFIVFNGHSMRRK